MSPAEARLKEVPSGMTQAEWTQRVNLAACYRLVALYGWDDLVDTHISARVPGPDHHFLINPYGLMFEEITASSLVKVDLHGNQLTKSDYSINPAGFTIHSAIHEAREDAGCVLHLHTLDGTAVSSCMEGLLPLNQTAQFVTTISPITTMKASLSIMTNARACRRISATRTTCSCAITAR